MLKAIRLSSAALLIQKAAGACRAAGIGLIAQIVAVLIQADQAEFFAADHQNTTGIGLQAVYGPHHRNFAVEAPAGFDDVRGGVGDRHSPDARQVESGQNFGQPGCRIAVMKSIGTLHDLMLVGYGSRRNGHRTDIDTEDDGIRRHDQSPKIFKLQPTIKL